MDPAESVDQGRHASTAGRYRPSTGAPSPSPHAAAVRSPDADQPTLRSPPRRTSPRNAGIASAYAYLPPHPPDPTATIPDDDLQDQAVPRACDRWAAGTHRTWPATTDEARRLHSRLLPEFRRRLPLPFFTPRIEAMIPRVPNANNWHTQALKLLATGSCRFYRRTTSPRRTKMS